jgi:protein tyrosine phosphatase (PTP) superfamily phosphohydrolase (DUF442 family)
MDISKITEYMYIAAHPKAEAASTIQALGVRLIINMIFYRPADIYKKPPFKLLTLRSFDSPFLPIQLSKLRKGVKTALPFIQNGDSVLIYCREGKHRSVAMASCILIGMGYSSDDAMSLISSKREKADPYARHIQRQIRRFEDSWNS